MRKIQLLLTLITLNCFSQNFDIQGHRGCRGLMPENSIEAMKKAIDLGVSVAKNYAGDCK